MQEKSYSRWALAVVAAATLAAFWPALGGGFVDYDDAAWVVDNPHFKGFSLENLRWMLTAFHCGNYNPLTWLSLALDHALWGMEPRGYHLTNVLLHAANAALFFVLARRLLARALPAAAPARLTLGAAFAALAFALHPLRVESVAWVSERRDVLFLFFWLLAVLAYEKDRLGRALGAYALSLLAKPMGMTLPLVLVLLDVYPLRRRPSWRRLLPFALLAAAIMVPAYRAQVSGESVEPLASFGWDARAVQPLFAAAFYLWKTALPLSLLPLSESGLRFDPWRAEFLLGAAAAALGAAAVLARHRRTPALAAAAAFYLVTLAPVSGLVKIGLQYAADRYTYLPLLGAALLAGGWLASARRRAPAVAAAALLLAVWGRLTWAQCGVWRGAETLWRHTVERAPRSFVGHSNLSVELARQGRSAEALAHARAAVAAEPRYLAGRANLAALLIAQGRPQAARLHLLEILKVRPDHAGAHKNLAVVEGLLGRYDAQIRHARELARLLPESAEARFNLGNALARRGSRGEAEEAYRQALRLDPGFAEAGNNLGLLLAAQGRHAEAAARYAEVARSSPTYASARHNWGNSLLAQGRLDEAGARFEEALALSPGLVEARVNLGNVLARRGRYAEAARHYELALERDPGNGPAARNLAAARKLLGH